MQSPDASPTIHHHEANAMNHHNTDTDAAEASTTDHDEMTATEIANDAAGSKPAKRKGKKSEHSPLPATPKVRIVKVNTCPSLSGRSELTYHMGCIGEAIQLRVYQNSGKGYFNQEWIPFINIMEVLDSQDPITAASLRSIFVGKSVNTAGFFLAVLKDLGLIELSKESRRSYTPRSVEAFQTEAAQLMASGISIEVAEKANTPSPIIQKGTLKLKTKKP